MVCYNLKKGEVNFQMLLVSNIRIVFVLATSAVLKTLEFGMNFIALYFQFSNAKLYSFQDLSLGLVLQFLKFQTRYSFKYVYALMAKKETLFESLVGVHALHKKAHNGGKQLKTYMIRAKKVSNVGDVVPGVVVYLHLHHHSLRVGKVQWAHKWTDSGCHRRP